MKKLIKYKIHDFGIRIHLLITFMFTSSSLDYLVFYSFGNEEKPVSLLIYSSFPLVATGGIRNSSVATSSTSFNSVSATSGIRNSSVTTSSTSFNSISGAQIRRDYGVTSIVRMICDITRLMATEHVRNKYSLRESIQNE